MKRADLLRVDGSRRHSLEVWAELTRPPTRKNTITHRKRNTMNIGKVIRRKRIEQGYTQEVLASYIEVSKSSISYYETGKKEPRAFVLIMLMGILNITPQEFLNGV